MHEMDKEHWMRHKKMMGFKLIILGALILGNIYFFGLDWPVFIGIIIILAGAGNLIMPCWKCKNRRR